MAGGDDLPERADRDGTVVTRLASRALILAYALSLVALLAAALRHDAARTPLRFDGETRIVSGGMDYALANGPLAGPDAVLTGPIASTFVPAGNDMEVRPMAYFDDGAMWLRVRPPSVDTPDGQVTLSLPDNRVRQARLVLARNGTVTVRDWRLDDDARRAGVSTNAPAFHFDAKELDGATVLIGYKSLSLLRTLLIVESRRAWEARVAGGAAWVLLMSGALAMLALLLAGLAVFLRNGDLALLAVLTGATMSIIFGGAGFVHTLLLPQSPVLADFIAYTPKPLGVTIWLVLLGRYLRLDITAPALFHALVIMGFAVAFQSVIVGFWMGYGVRLPFMTTSAMPVLAALAAGMAVLAWRAARGDRRALVFALCWAPVAVGLGIRSAIILSPDAGSARFLAQDRFLDVILSLVLLSVALIVGLQRRTQAARLRAESAEERFRGFAGLVGQGFFELSADGRIVTAAGPLAERIGLAPGRSFAAALAAAGAAPEAVGRLATADGAARDIEIPVPGGSPAILSFAIGPGPSGGRRGAIADVTERVSRRREESRQRTLVALGEMATSVAHEVNNLIHPIVNLARRLKDRHVTSEEGRRLSDLVIASGERAGVIVASVMSNVRAAEPNGHAEPLPSALSNALDSLAPTIPASIRFRRNIAAGTAATIDPGELLQVLANLVGNAVRALKGSGSIDVSLETLPGRNLIIVEDDGPGVPDTILAQGFRAFAEGGDGSAGLGLSIVASIAARLGGQFTLENRPQGGARAVIDLPDGNRGQRHDTA